MEVDKHLIVMGSRVLNRPFMRSLCGLSLVLRQRFAKPVDWTFCEVTGESW